MPVFNPDDYVALAPMKCEDGDYNFSVVDAKEQVSKNGNDMINLEIQVDVGAEKPLTVYDRLVFTPKALFRIKDFCDAVGLSDKFASGELNAEDCIGIEGQARVVLGLENDKGKRYMEIGWYIKPGAFAESPKPSRLSPEASKKLAAAKASLPQPAGANLSPNDDDDIPF